jgi:oligoribonuclease NrnB/cAMP/cGMP phosphodiesterase (DHH superfamily)
MEVDGRDFEQLKDNFDLVVYHKNCHDGSTAYAVVRKYYSEKLGRQIEGIACAYDDPTPRVSGRNVLIVDFSFSLEITTNLKKEANSFFLLDHHVSAKRELENESGCFFDLSRSGAMLAWDFFFTGIEAPKFVKYVQDKDLWQWKLPNSRDFNVALETVSFDPIIWDSMLNNETIVEDMIGKGIVFSDYKRFIVERIVSRAESFSWESLNGNSLDSVLEGGLGSNSVTVSFVNSDVFVNEIGEKLYGSGECGVAIVWNYSHKKSSFRFSLRSNTVDTSLIAKKFGGGGHPGASGFYWTKSLEDFFSENCFRTKETN